MAKDISKKENEGDTSPIENKNCTDNDKEEKELPLYEFINKTNNDQKIIQRFNNQMKSIYEDFKDDISNYCILMLFDINSDISQYDSNRIFRALSKNNADTNKDILLVILSNGGQIEPAYQISKLCKKFSKEKFITVIPRQAKSAATLICLGADEIHIGPLGQLGPIDPQLGGLPALGVVQALDRLASLSVKYPNSAEMISSYLQKALTVEQIGYCERISESAVQYAKRLLSTKSFLESKQLTVIAKKLVYEYKHHGFVIDSDEAIEVLGEKWLKTQSKEIDFCEEIYLIFEDYNLLLNIFKNKRLLVIGNLFEGAMIFNK
jgi:membrane-bound ClpP family serine protease